MPRATECSYCQSGPRDIEGHQGLFLADIERGPDYDAGTPLFRCSVCDHCWERTYRGEGVFRWRRVPGLMTAPENAWPLPDPPDAESRA